MIHMSFKSPNSTLFQYIIGPNQTMNLVLPNFHRLSYVRELLLSNAYDESSNDTMPIQQLTIGKLSTMDSSICKDPRSQVMETILIFNTIFLILILMLFFIVFMDGIKSFRMQQKVRKKNLPITMNETNSPESNVVGEESIENYILFIVRALFY